MTATQKAKELYDRYIVYSSDDTIDKRDRTAKQCAQICVNEILETISIMEGDDLDLINRVYWIDVNEHIRKL